MDYWMVGWLDGLQKMILRHAAKSMQRAFFEKLYCSFIRCVVSIRWENFFPTRRRAIPLLPLFTLLLFSACDKTPKSSLTVPVFDGQAAYGLLVEQCDFGPRVPETPAHDSCRVFLVAELQKYADRVAEQNFEEYLDGMKKNVKLTNLIASFDMAATQRILLCAHWDSRPWATEDPDTSKRRQPVPGANDGASGVAVLLEVAKALKRTPPPVGVDIVFFDGEDAGISGQSDTYLAGSRYFARTKDVRFNPMMGILLDMVGDADLQIYKEENSVNYAGGVVDRVWSLAGRIGVAEFMPTVKHSITDDHLPLLNAGIPVIDIIDFDYDYWHTTSDTPDKCSAQSLEKVGRVVLAAVYNP
jgi:Peptidase family M28